MYFVFIFSECIAITSSEEVLKVCEHNFFEEIQVKSSVTCNLVAQFRFIQVNFLHVEYGIWGCVEYGFCLINWSSLFLAIQRLQEHLWLFTCSKTIRKIILHFWEKNMYDFYKNFIFLIFLIFFFFSSNVICIFKINICITFL